MNELQLAIPSFTDLPPEEITAFASQNISILRKEEEEIKRMVTQAAERAWVVGKSCVYLKDSGTIQPELWEEWSRDNIGGGDYTPVWRMMRFYRLSQDKPPGRIASQCKQVLIMFGDEPMPKTTPRKTDAKKFTNFKAAAVAIVRWWRDGDVTKGFDRETMEEIASDLEPIVKIYAQIKGKLEDEA